MTVVGLALIGWLMFDLLVFLVFFGAAWLRRRGRRGRPLAPVRSLKPPRSVMRAPMPPRGARAAGTGLRRTGI
jgi:hypothetical protein